MKRLAWLWDARSGEVQSAFSLPLTISVAILSVLPGLLVAIGVEFGSPNFSDEIARFVADQRVERVDSLFFAMRGPFVHTVLEWSGVLLALVVSVLAFGYFRVTKNSVAPVVGVAFFTTAVLDAYHTLAADRVIGFVADSSAFMPFTWALSRTLHAVLLIVGAALILSVGREKSGKSRAVVTGAVYGAGVLFSYFAVRVIAFGNILPQAARGGFVESSSLDLLPLFLFVGVAPWVFSNLFRKNPSVFTYALLAGLVPNVMAQLHMVFGSDALYDTHFNIAHFLKVLSYGVPLAGLVLDYSQVYRTLYQETAVRIAMADALQKSEERWHYALEGAQNGVWDWSPKTGKAFFSIKWKALLGFEPAEMPDRMEARIELIHPDDIRHVENQLALHMDGVLSFYRAEFRMKKKDGRYGWFEESGKVQTHDSEGKPTRVIGILSDVTSRRRVHEALEDSEARHRAVADTMVDALVTIDEKGIVESINPAGERMFGYSYEDIVGKNVKVLMPSPYRDEHDEYLEKYKQTGLKKIIGIGREVVARRKDGTTFPADLAVAEMALQGRRFFSGTIRDITDRKKVEEERDRSMQLKDEFLASMSHELRTPLNAILGLSEVMLEGVYGSVSKKQRNAINTIEKSGRHLLSLINDVLDLSKIGAGKVELKVSDLDVQSLMQEVLELVRAQAQAKGIRLESRYDGAVASFRGDARRVRQVLLNLLSNAIKFTEGGGKVGLDAVGSYEKGVVTFHVSDTGEGIADDKQQLLFEPFVQLDSGLDRRHQGTGLGLALVKRLVDLHDGTVSIESAVGVGTTFSVTFKIGEIGDVAPVGSDHGPKGSVADVILVEDQGAAAEVLSQYLSQVGATVTHLSDGRNVVEVTKMKQPAAVVLDIVLPDHSGWDILKALKANPSTSHIPIIVVTILDEPEKSKALGAAVHLTKPVTKSQFQEAIRSVAPLAKQVIVAKDAATVLLVEDNPANLFVKDYLENQGFVVHVAENGPRGIEVARTVVPDIVLMDIQMPGMTGFEAMEIIRKDARLKNVKIVATTGLAMTGDRQRCLDAGADDYLAKPYRLEELEWVIANLLKHDLIS